MLFERGRPGSYRVSGHSWAIDTDTNHNLHGQRVAGAWRAEARKTQRWKRALPTGRQSPAEAAVQPMRGVGNPPGSRGRVQTDVPRLCCGQSLLTRGLERLCSTERSRGDRAGREARDDEMAGRQNEQQKRGQRAMRGRRRWLLPGKKKVGAGDRQESQRRARGKGGARPVRGTSVVSPASARPLESRLVLLVLALSAHSLFLHDTMAHQGLSPHVYHPALLERVRPVRAPRLSSAPVSALVAPSLTPYRSRPSPSVCMTARAVHGPAPGWQDPGGALPSRRVPVESGIRTRPPPPNPGDCGHAAPAPLAAR